MIVCSAISFGLLNLLASIRKRRVCVAKYSTFVRIMSTVSQKFLISRQTLLNKRLIFLIQYKIAESRVSRKSYSIISTLLQGSPKFNTLQVEWYSPLNTPLAYGLLVTSRIVRNLK